MRLADQRFGASVSCSSNVFMVAECREEWMFFAEHLVDCRFEHARVIAPRVLILPEREVIQVAAGDSEVGPKLLHQCQHAATEAAGPHIHVGHEGHTHGATGLADRCRMGVGVERTTRQGKASPRCGRIRLDQF